MAVFEVTDKTILKILVRRGLEEERQSVRLDEGELGYTIDSKRLFVGDGLGGGGNVVGNLYQGAFPDVDTVITTVAGLQPGDTFYDTTESTLYALGEDAATKFDIHPRYEEFVLEKTTSPVGRVRISESVFGKSVVGVTNYRKAFFFDYALNEPFYGTNRVAELNTNYWAITSKSNFNPANNDGVFYFGNIGSIVPGQVKSDLDYRININTAGLNKGALIVYGTGTDVFTIGTGGEIGNALGITSIIGASGIQFFPGTDNKNDPSKSALFLSASGTAYFQKTGGTASQPAFLVDGFSRFTNSVMVDSNLLVVGNLTALGDFTVLDTLVTTSSALSVINSSPNTAFTVRQEINNSLYNTALFSNLAIPSNRVIIDRYCNASFGIGYGLDSRGSGSTNTAAMSSVLVAGGLFLRDVSPSNYGGLNVSVRGNSQLQSGFNFIDGTNGNVISIGKATPTYYPSGVALLVDAVGVDTGGVKILNNPAYGSAGDFPALVLASNQPTGNAGHYLFSGRFNGNGGSPTNGTQTSFIASDGSFQFNGNGTVQGYLNVAGDVTAFFSSDEKLKENVQVLESSLEKIDKIRGVSFDWSADAPHAGHDVGVIAQEIEKVLPEVVVTRENGMKAVRYEKLVPLLIEGIKELHKLIKCQQ
jgi:hypothetical protein